MLAVTFNHEGSKPTTIATRTSVVLRDHRELSDHRNECVTGIN
jgi:hypothetical protein